ncbi:S-layer homology domain-containing protein [Caldifermentibacillus hisashii]|uniref:S-layer homology domain-containing protein n=1 Tax=Caldifermentibacillus hisashii TaxID=996558 RepID=UPI0034D4EE48
MAKQKTSRKAFATTAAAVMAATAVTPVAAFAASTTSFPDVPAGEYADAINNLVGKGIINGFDDGTFKPNDPVLREQAAKILATALKLDTTGTENYPDVSPDNWSYKYIVAVTKAGIFGGDESGKFNPFANLTRQEAAKIIVEAFDFTGSSELTFGDKANIQSWAVPYVKTAVANGILKGDDQGNFNPNANIKRGDFALMIQRALNAVENAKTPKVESVSAINATQVVVKFNKEVDKTDAETVARYSINGVNPSTAVLGSDKKSVTLTFAAANQVEVTNGVLVVEPVKLAADTDKTTQKYTQVFTYEDTVKPEIASVEAKTNGTVATSLTVKASEPIQSALAKVDGTYYTVNFGGTDTATITGLSLEANKTHTLELINLTDKGGNVTVSTSKSFNVTVDTVAPTATLTPQGDKQILVTFNKPMDVSTVAAAFAANTAVKDETLSTVNHDAVVSAVSGSNDTQFVINITSTLYTNKNTRTLTVVFPSTIKDKLGNAMVAGTQTVTLTKDTAKPVPTGYRVVKNANGEVTAIDVTFSEGLAANANPAEPTIVNMNGVDVTSSFLGGLTASAITAGDKKVTFTAATPAKISGKYAFSFGAGLVTDQSETGNTSDAFNYTIDFGSGATTFSLPSAPTATNNVITVEFGRAVKGGAVANSATDVNNYTLGGKPLPQGTTIVLDAAQDTATITLPAGTIEKTDANAVFTVANVMSLNGEMLNTYTGTVSVVDNVKPVLNSATLNNDGTVSIGFDETLTAGPDADDLKVTVNGVDLATTAYTVTPITVGAEAGKYLLTVNGLVDNGTDGNSGGGDDILYVDVNGNSVYNAGTDIVVTTGNVTAGTVSLKNAVFTSVKVGTVASPNTGKDADNNFLKGNVVLTVK